MKANCRTVQAGVKLITLDGSRLNLLSFDFRAVARSARRQDGRDAHGDA